MDAAQHAALIAEQPDNVTTAATMAKCHAAELALSEITKRVARHPLPRSRFLSIEALLENLLRDQSLEGVVYAINEATLAIEGKARDLDAWSECFSPDGRIMYVDPIHFEDVGFGAWEDECGVVRVAAVITNVIKSEVREWLLTSLIACARRSIEHELWIEEVEWFLRQGNAPSRWAGPAQEAQAVLASDHLGSGSLDVVH